MTKTILFVDDEPEFVRPQVTALEEAGYKVTLQSDPDEVLRLLKDQIFDLIILDIIIPPQVYELEDEDEFALIETGVKLHEDIRGKLGIVDIPIIFLTVVRDQAIQNGIGQLEKKHGHRLRILAKPTSSLTVVDEVKKALGEYRV